MQASEKTLYSKYLLFCAELSKNETLFTTKSSEINGIKNTNYSENIKKLCDKKAQQVYQQEQELVQKIITINNYNSINEKMFDNMSLSTFTQDTSFNAKLMKLFDKFTIVL
jgi:hypothetical protein